MKKKMTNKEYREFMGNPANSMNCSQCPEYDPDAAERNRNAADFRLPCGQQNCWVDCHCRKV